MRRQRHVSWVDFAVPFWFSLDYWLELVCRWRGREPSREIGKRGSVVMATLSNA